MPERSKMPDSPGPTTAQASAVAFMVAGATLALQILIHRVVSAKLLNNYAFLVISLTMLGFAISGAALTAAQRIVAKRLNDVLVVGACGLSLSAMASTALFASSTQDTVALISRADLVRSFLQWGPYAFLFTIPFAFAGIMLGALLADEGLPTRRVYFFDLMGSALGALVVLPLFRFVSVETALVTVAIGLVVGVMAALRPRSAAFRALGLTTLVILFVVAERRNEFFAIYFPESTMLAATRHPEEGMVLEYLEWDPLARIEVTTVPGRAPMTGRFASLFGENADFLRRYRKVLTQNNYAFTYAVDYDGREESLTGIEETIYASAYEATSVEKPKVAVIGVGGGFDILTALRFHASEVTGMEINAATLNILRNVYRDYFHHWVDDPRVRLVHADGRHYLASTNERFDVIQLSGVDSYSGTPGAAHVFSENYLYTAEAFDLYLSRLSNDGILNMMRLEHSPPREMLRALTTAVAALRRAGVREPGKHIVTLTEKTGAFTALLVKRSPFSETELARLEAWASKRPSFGISARPGSSSRVTSNLYQTFLFLEDPRREQQFIDVYPLAIDPVTDDRPFFFNFSFWSHLLPGKGLLPGVASPVPILQLSLVLLAAAVSLAVAVAIFLPLVFLRGRGLPAEGRGRLGIYCAGAALGYLAVEVALMQRFGLFLGHPNYAISVVLAALLFSSGLGSLWAAAIVSRLTSIRFVAYALSAIIFCEYFLILPGLTPLLDLPFATRALLVFVLIFPIGVCLGVFLPTAIEQMKQRSPGLVPWAWGVNGVFSVLSPILAVAVATTFGISALLLSSVPIYLVVAFSLPGPPEGASPRPL